MTAARRLFGIYAITVLLSAAPPWPTIFTANDRMRLRVMDFSRAWTSFAGKLFDCTGRNCGLPNVLNMSDYVKSCEKAKELYPMLKGNCRDTKALGQLFDRR